MSVCKKIVRYFAILAVLGFGVCVLGYGALFAVEHYFPAPYGGCSDYTAALNGGVREFKGKKLNVTMCGRSGHLNWKNGDIVRLQVHSMEGELLAERFFIVNWESPEGFRPVHYDDDQLVYFSDGEYDGIGTDAKTLSMPPTLQDWIQARLP